MARYGDPALWQPCAWSIVIERFRGSAEELNMSISRRTAISASLAIAVAGRAWAQAKGKKIVLGQSVPLTGAASEIGLAFAAGAKLYVDNFNGRKNGPGYAFELRQLDDGYDPAKASANAKKLLADGADVLFGFVGTGSSEAGAEVAAT